MYVIGATKASYLKKIRKIIPNNFLLIPGIGAQGGDLKEACQNGINNQVGILVNSSRSIIYASNKKDIHLYSKKNERTINPFSKKLKINWPIKKIVTSNKDLNS